MKHSFWFVMLVVMIGAVAGLLVGDLLMKFFPSAGPYLKVFSAGFDLRELNLYFIVVGIKFYLRLNLAALIGIVISLWLFLRGRRR